MKGSVSGTNAEDLAAALGLKIKGTLLQSLL